MGFLDIFRPKWKHSNPEVRKAAVAKINDQKILADVAKNDEVAYVREVALNKITDSKIH